MYLTTRCTNNNIVYFIICLVVVIFALTPFLKKESAFSIEKLEKIKEFIVHDLAITIPICIRFGDEGFNFPDLIHAAQLELDYELHNLRGNKWRFKLVNELASNNVSADDDGKYILELTHSNENFLIIEPHLYKAQMHYTQASIHANDLPYFMAQAILDHLMSPEIELQKRLEGPYQPVNYPSIDAKIITLGKKSKYYASIFEENLNITFDSFRTRILDISNVTITITVLDLLKEDEMNNAIIKSPGTLYYFYSHIQDQYSISHEILHQSNVSFIQNDSLTNQDVAYYTSEIKNDIQNLLGIPENPTNNLSMKLSAMKRYLMLLGFIKSIDLLLTAIIENKQETTKGIRSVVNNLYPIIDCLHNNESEHDWNHLLVRSIELREASSRLANSKY